MALLTSQRLLLVLVPGCASAWLLQLHTPGLSKEASAAVKDWCSFDAHSLLPFAYIVPLDSPRLPLILRPACALVLLLQTAYTD